MSGFRSANPGFRLRPAWRARPAAVLLWDWSSPALTLLPLALVFGRC